MSLLGLPYTFTFGKVNVDPALETLSQLLIALSISFTLAQPSDTKKSVQLPTELHIITLRELFHQQFLSIILIEWIYSKCAFKGSSPEQYLPVA